eukprot:861718-Lingulodinium_polyedra.AAC.1
MRAPTEESSCARARHLQARARRLANRAQREAQAKTTIRNRANGRPNKSKQTANVEGTTCFCYRARELSRTDSTDL